nr:atherin-like [Aegilops tauschii subsp. strangulata]
MPRWCVPARARRGRVRPLRTPRHRTSSRSSAPPRSLPLPRALALAPALPAFGPRPGRASPRPACLHTRRGRTLFPVSSAPPLSPSPPRLPWPSHPLAAPGLAPGHAHDRAHCAPRPPPRPPAPDASPPRPWPRPPPSLALSRGRATAPAPPRHSDRTSATSRLHPPWPLAAPASPAIGALASSSRPAGERSPWATAR